MHINGKLFPFFSLSILEYSKVAVLLVIKFRLLWGKIFYGINIAYFNVKKEII